MNRRFLQLHTPMSRLQNVEKTLFLSEHQNISTSDISAGAQVWTLDSQRTTQAFPDKNKEVQESTDVLPKVEFAHNLNKFALQIYTHRDKFCQVVIFCIMP